MKTCNSCKFVISQKLINDGCMGIYHNCRHPKFPYASFNASIVCVLGDGDKIEIPALPECPLNKSIFKRMFVKKTHGMTGKIIRMWEHKFWGDSIGWSSGFKYPVNRIAGHLRGLEVGDEIRAVMTSGKVVRHRICSVEYETDPPDMVWAETRAIGRLSDSENEKELKRQSDFAESVLNNPAKFATSSF